MKKRFRLFLIFLFSVHGFSIDAGAASQPRSDQTNGDNDYSRPGLFTFIQKAPGDLVDVAHETFRKENTGAFVWMAVGTGVLIVMDQTLVDKAHRLGTRLGISHTGYQKTFARVRVPPTSKDLNFEGPFDSGSALYFLGDGWTDVVMIGGFMGYGLVQSDNRALQTSSQIAESILTSGAVVQTLKHVTGRESPFTTDTPRGNWRFFPNQYEYARHVPSYDAFPSGHLAAMMAAVTVIANNYPEYTYVRPVGYSLMTVLSFQMLNNGVHWASDYPLGIWLGYAFGKMAVRKGRTPRTMTAENIWEFSPMVLNAGIGLEARFHFSGKPKPEEDD